MEDFGKYDNGADFSEISSNNVTILSVATELVQDTIKTKSDSTPSKPTPEQIRFWKWQREKKMFITGSHFVIPKETPKLIVTKELSQSGLELPIREKNSFNSDWITILLIFLLVLLASVRIAYSKYISTLFQSVFNYSTSFRMYREKNNSILHAAFRLEAFFYLTFSIFIFQLLNFLQLDIANTNFVFFARVLGVVIVWFLLKKITYHLLGMIIKGVSETSEYLFNLDNSNRVIGILLLPLVILIAFYPFGSPYFIVYIGVFAVAFFYLMLLKRGISILIKKQFPIFYLFLYLCTLEFLPLILIYKVIVD